MDVSKNNGIPKSSILIGFSITNHPFWATHILGTTPYGTLGKGMHRNLATTAQHYLVHRQKFDSTLDAASLFSVAVLQTCFFIGNY